MSQAFAPQRRRTPSVSNTIPRSSPSPAPVTTMTAATRYQSNLKVLRRRDPSIQSIMDQFSHVCVYQHQDGKWVKGGYEGSMFLYEREVYPPYGFYILNRAGMMDYNQPLLPEDMIWKQSSFVMVRCFPQFTEKRLASLGIPPPMDVFDSAYKFDTSNVPEDKGTPKLVGLWSFTTDAREPLIDVMQRLHSYIKDNVPYPDEYRYGLTHPPPPNSTSVAPTPSPAPASELDQLFAKLKSSHEPSPQHTPARPTSTVHTTVDSLFANLSARQTPAPEAPSPLSQYSKAQTPVHDPPAPTPKLLEAIFASARVDDTQSPYPANTSFVVESYQTIQAPTPAVLNQDVISTLLGLPSPVPSSASASSHEADIDSSPSPVQAHAQPLPHSRGPASYIRSPAHATPNGIDSTPKVASRSFFPEAEDRAASAATEDDDEILELDFSDTSALSGYSNYQRTPTAPALVPPAVNGLNGKHKAKEPKPNEKVHVNGTNGAGAGASVETTRKSSVTSTPTTVSGVSEAAVKHSLLDTLFAQKKPIDVGIGKNDFVREVLTLIHMNKPFVDDLWAAYVARASHNQ